MHDGDGDKTTQIDDWERPLGTRYKMTQKKEGGAISVERFNHEVEG